MMRWRAEKDSCGRGAIREAQPGALRARAPGVDAFGAGSERLKQVGPPGLNARGFRAEVGAVAAAT